MSSGFFETPRHLGPSEETSQVTPLAEELERLVDRMEDEVRDTGTISVEASELLSELRRRLEQVFGRKP